ncbi:MAG: TRAP transporter large permease subunit, partial [Sphaerochaetaceae bacterium]|nr:TRAP transporter large permease subunit [Sphaerochaetaceae bacterium]
IFLPLAKTVGIDPVHFGILFCTIITMGNMTPPVGLAMYAVCQILEIQISDYIRNMWAFIVTIMIMVGVLMFFPRLVLLLPNLLFG